jgi:hypothetical protein
MLFSCKYLLSYLISEPDSERITDVFDDEEADNNTEYSHLPESFYKTHAHPPEDETNKESRQVTIPNC